MNSTPQVSRPATNPAGSVLKIVRLKREGALGRGDTVSTDTLGECVVTGIPCMGSLAVRRVLTNEQIVISGIDFPPGVTMNMHAPDPRDDIRR